MARDTGPRGRVCRRLGVALSNISAKDPDKDPVLRRPYPPGQHGAASRPSVSDYGQRLREKQKLKLFYGLLENQCRRAFLEARRSPGNTGTVLLQQLPVVRNSFERMKGRSVPAHLVVVEDGRGVRYTRVPEREEIPVDVNVPFIVEFYAQRA